MSSPSHAGGFRPAGSPGSRFLVHDYELLAWRCRAYSEQINLLWTEIALLGLIDLGLLFLAVRSAPLMGRGGSAAAMTMAAVVACLGLSGWSLWTKIKRLRILRRELAAVTFEIEGPEDEW